MSAPASARARHHEQRTLWGRLLDGVLPAADPDRLVSVGDVARASLPLVAECFEDAQAPLLTHELTSRFGAEPRYEVLVPARHARAAAEVVSTL
jgi:hypothetical protein